MQSITKPNQRDSAALHVVPAKRWTGPLASKRRFTLLVVAILVAAFVLGVVVASHLRSGTTSDLLPDEKEYQRLAVELLTSGSYSSNYWLPAFPALAAITYSLVGIKPSAVYVVNSALFALTLLMVFKITLKVTGRRSTALIVLLLCALWPRFYTQMVASLLTEALCAALIALGLWFLILALEKPSYGNCGAAGFCIALAVLSKSVMLAFVPIALILLLVAHGRQWKTLRHAATFFVACMLVLVPWNVRNYRVTGEFVPVSIGAGYNFWLGNYPGVPRGWQEYPAELGRRLQGKPDTEQDRILMREGVRYVREDPGRAVVLCVRKFGALWLGGLGTNPAYSLNTDMPRVGSFGIPKTSVLFVPMFVLAVLGWFAMPVETKRRALPIVILLILWSLAYTLITAVSRYALPVQFYELMFIAIALESLRHRLWPAKAMDGREASPEPAAV